jgi:hypothetical protein
MGFSPVKSGAIQCPLLGETRARKKPTILSEFPPRYERSCQRSAIWSISSRDRVIDGVSVFAGEPYRHVNDWTSN